MDFVVVVAAVVLVVVPIVAVRLVVNDDYILVHTVHNEAPSKINSCAIFLIETDCYSITFFHFNLNNIFQLINNYVFSKSLLLV